MEILGDLDVTTAYSFIGFGVIAILMALVMMVVSRSPNLLIPISVLPAGFVATLIGYSNLDNATLDDDVMPVALEMIRAELTQTRRLEFATDEDVVLTFTQRTDPKVMIASIHKAALCGEFVKAIVDQTARDENIPTPKQFSIGGERVEMTSVMSATGPRADCMDAIQKNGVANIEMFF